MNNPVRLILNFFLLLSLLLFAAPLCASELKLNRSVVVQGATLTQTLRDQQPMVTDLAEDSPAADSGLRVNDEIIRINNSKTKGMSLEFVKKALDGESGTTVPLSVIRDFEIVTLTLKRQKMTAPPKKEMTIEVNPKMAPSSASNSGTSFTTPSSTLSSTQEERVAAMEKRINDLERRVHSLESELTQSMMDMNQNRKFQNIPGLQGFGQ